MRTKISFAASKHIRSTIACNCFTDKVILHRQYKKSLDSLSLYFIEPILRSTCLLKNVFKPKLENPNSLVYLYFIHVLSLSLSPSLSLSFYLSPSPSISPTSISLALSVILSFYLSLCFFHSISLILSV